MSRISDSDVVYICGQINRGGPFLEGFCDLCGDYILWSPTPASKKATLKICVGCFFKEYDETLEAGNTADIGIAYSDDEAPVAIEEEEIERIRRDYENSKKKGGDA